MAKTPTPEPAPEPKPKRRPRRVTAPGTGPKSADGPEPRLTEIQPETDDPKNGKKLSERDRWFLEQRPPHY